MFEYLEIQDNFSKLIKQEYLQSLQNIYKSDYCQIQKAHM